MSKEQDRATNKSLRVGISGENPLPDLKVFTVEETIVPIHDSDCAIYNGPAYPAGECNCSAINEVVAGCATP